MLRSGFGSNEKPTGFVFATRTTSNVRCASIALAGLVLTGCVLGWALGPLPPTRIGAHLGLFGVAFVAYLASLAAARGLSRRGLLACLGLALLWRALLVAAPPLLGNDINRYVWEGRVQVHGGNPYRWGDRPESPRWLPLRDAVYDGLNHKDYTAVYPPLFVLAVVAVRDSFTAMKAFLVACEMATLGALALVLRRRRLPLERLLLLAWSPLALVEVAGAGTTRPSACSGWPSPSSRSRRTGRSCRPSSRARASSPSTFRASWPSPGPGATGGGTS